MKKVLMLFISIVAYLYYNVKGFILKFMNPKNGRSVKQIIHDLIEKDRNANV